MPRPKTEALVELSCWMEQAHQLASALAVLDTRCGSAKPARARRSKKKAALAKPNANTH